MIKPLFRLATEDDRDFISQLSARVFSIFGHYDEILTNCFLQPGVITVIAMERDRPLGFAMLQLGGIGDLDSFTGELLSIAVIPEYQEQGIGKALLSYIESLALQYGLSEIRLYTAQDNFPARSLFQKVGFKIIGDRESFYPKGQSALVMVKMLSS